MKSHNRLASRYTLTTAASCTVDNAVFFLLLYLMKKRSVRFALLFSAVASRLISAPLNYNLHRRFTFAGRKKHSLRRYCILGSAVLAISCTNIYLWENLYPGAVLLAKPAGDALLGLFMPAIHKKWVFALPDDRRFYGDYARFIKWISKFVLKRYPVGDAEEASKNQPVVYVCRHGNMRGPVNTLSNFTQDVHPMVLSCFFNVKDCRRHFYEFTFASRFGIPRFLAMPAALIASLITVPMMHSLKAIPVHRDGSAISTLRTAVRYLEAGESVIVFPDVSYTANEGDCEIYRGFVSIGHLYMKATGKPLRFIPLVLDEKNMRITALDSFIWQKGSDRDEAADFLRRSIHSDLSDTTSHKHNSPCAPHLEVRDNLSINS